MLLKIEKMLLGFILGSILFSVWHFYNKELNSKIPKNTFKLYLYEDVYPSKNITHILDFLTRAHNQNVKLYINTLGGDVGLEQRLMRAIQYTDNNIQVIVNGWASSAGAMIAMARPEVLKVHSLDKFYIHFVVDENGNMLDPQEEYSVKYADQLTLDTFKGLLTKQEIDNMYDGGHVIINGLDFSHRLCANRHLCDSLIKEVK